MYADLTREDLLRLPMETRVMIDMWLEHGATIKAVSKSSLRRARLSRRVQPYIVETDGASYSRWSEEHFRHLDELCMPYNVVPCEPDSTLYNMNNYLKRVYSTRLVDVFPSSAVLIRNISYG